MFLLSLLTASLLVTLPQAPAADNRPFLAPELASQPAFTSLDSFPPGLPGALDYSLAYLKTPAAATLYGQRGDTPFSLDRVRRSVARFRQLLQANLSPVAFQEKLTQEFEFHQVAGDDRAGSILFTGYFEPTYEASRTPTATYRFPLFRRPKDFATWPKPHPTRVQLVGPDGLQAAKGPLKGLEVVWLKDRFQAFLVEVQGSARLHLSDGGTMTVGNEAIMDYPYVSLGKLMVTDQLLKAGEVTLPAMIAYFNEHPGTLDGYLSRCNRMVFFRDTEGSQPMGCLNVPVTALCSVATDKDLFPAGGLALIELELPSLAADGTPGLQRVQRFVLDQDSGGPIKGPWRFDYFMGSGPEAGAQAGLMNKRGKAWYLLLKAATSPTP